MPWLTVPTCASARASTFDSTSATTLELVGGDQQALREIEDLCLTETPRLLEAMPRA